MISQPQMLGSSDLPRLKRPARPSALLSLTSTLSFPAVIVDFRQSLSNLDNPSSAKPSTLQTPSLAA